MRAVVARHGMLRTRFTADGRQIEEPSADIAIGRFDLRAETAQAQRERRLALREERSHRILPADRAPMVAAEVTILADDRMVLHVGHDGLVMDGISMFLFFRDWWAAYTDGSGASGASGSSVEVLRRFGRRGFVRVVRRGAGEGAHPQARGAVTCVLARPAGRPGPASGPAAADQPVVDRQAALHPA